MQGSSGHRHSEQTQIWVAEEEGEAGTDGERSMETHMQPHVKQTASGEFAV